MNKFLLITKINLLRTFNLTNLSFKTKNERRKRGLKVVLITGIIVYLLFYVYYLTKTLMPTFVMLNQPLYMIAFLLVVCTVFIFFSNLFKIKSVLFDFKDYDLLMSLPVKRSFVLTSKIVALYIINLIYTLIVMIPGYIAYIQFANIPYDGVFFLLLFTIPLIPLLLSIIIGIILTWITSFFKNKTIASYIVTLLPVFLVLLITFKTNEMSELELVNKSINVVDWFSHYYPFTTLFVDLLSSFNIVRLLIYLLFPIVLMAVFIIFINRGYLYLRTKLLKVNVKSDYEVKGYKDNSSLVSLYKKEIRKYFSSSLYAINSSFGCVMLIFLIISILLFNDNVISRFSNMMNMNEMIKGNIFLIISTLCVVSSTTNSAISLEGKSLWIMKMLPVNSDTIFLSKILVNLTILIPTVIIGGTFFGIYLHLPFTSFLLIYLTPLAYSLFAASFGLLANLMFPKFDYDNEVKVIKQSLPVFLTILFGIMMVLIPFKLFNITTISLAFITLFVLIIDAIIVVTIHFYGRRKMIRL